NVDELNEAGKEIIRAVQRKSFIKETLLLHPRNVEESSLFRLDPILAKDGIIRVGGRIRLAHQGRGMTHNSIRSSGFWIIGGVSAVSNHISKCVKCRKLITSDPAISLDTSSFMNAYRRFVGRRGPIRQLRSDRGTNFVGCRTELQAALSEMNQETVSQKLLKENCDFIKFQMNVPHASHMGGSWERQIRSVRNVLSALLDAHGEQLDDESLRTFMVEAEAIINSRPLSLNFASDLEPLTPNHLLTMKSNIILPPPGEFQRADVYSKKRWRRVQYLINEFWSGWKKEFLQSLQTRQKWVRPQKNLKKGDIVVVNDEDLPRNQWKLARVAETFPSDDALVRKVKLAMADSTLDSRGRRKRPISYLNRPVHKLVLLLSYYMVQEEPSFLIRLSMPIDAETTENYYRR
ncbi:uncharacterized protein LOC113666921, partial [Paramuricea clavata]